MEFWKVLLVTTIVSIVVLPTALGVATTYVVALLGQDIQIGSATMNIEYELVIVNKEAAEITVVIKSINTTMETLTVAANERTSHTLGHAMAMNGSEFSNKSIEVHSNNGKFVLQVFSKRNNYVEGLLAIPIGEMNGPNQVINRTVYEYVVATFCAVGGYCQVAIAAAENNTEVFIDVPQSVDEIALCNESSYFRTHRDTSFTMNKFDALQLETTYDLTGTVIFSFKPISVFVGSRNVTNGNVVAHTMEQLVPSSNWGTEFVVQTLGSNGYGDILKIVSHYTSTEVTMSGFPSFIMTDRYQTVTRRLSKGTRSYIKTSHPVQVVQISGLSYATQGESSTLSMSVVPSIQNAWNEFTVSCHGTHTTSQFRVVSEKTSCAKTLAGTQTYQADPYGCDSYVFESRMKYTKYLIGKLHGDNGTDTTKVSNTDSPINGILKCDDTVTMPLGIQYNENVTGTIPVNVSDHPGGICFEGGSATTYFSPLGTPTLPYILDITNYQSEHVLKLRVQVCGSAVLQFTSQSAEDLIIVAIISHRGVQIKACDPNCEIYNGVSNTSDSVNMEARIDCSSDMSFFWVFQTIGMFCIGTGYQHKPEMCVEDGRTPDNLIRIITNSRNLFSSVSMIGQFSDATFNWDFVHISGCKAYENGWRCVDKVQNCSHYEVGFCTAFRDFASFNCAKFCGICFPDSYGRKFLVKTPFMQTGYCSILISSLNQHTHVAVTLMLKSPIEERETVLHGTGDENGVRHYDCSESFTITSMLNTIAILSDDDVAVVMYQEIGEVIKATRMYPVDTFGNEFMILEHNAEEKECRFLSEDDNLEYTAYYSVHWQKGSQDSVREPADIYTVFSMQNGNDMSGTSFTFTRPSSVFCIDTKEHTYNQLLPIDTWSNEYVVPDFDINRIKYPLLWMLHIVSTADNTIVNISGGFDAIHALYNKGDKIEQMIDVTTAYKVVASERIGVGLYINDSAGMSSFTLLSPVQNLHDTVLTSLASVQNHPDTVKAEVSTNDALVFDKEVHINTEIFTSYIHADLTTSMNHTDDLDGEWSYQILHTGEAVYEMTFVRSSSAWYIVPGNVKTKYLNQVSKTICSVSVAGPNDEIDNDCDGLFDEEGYYGDAYGVYKEDIDMDGDFGDDCGGNLITSSVVVTAPKVPMCLEFEEVPGQCWVPFMCPCSWVEKLEMYKNLSHEELVQALKNATDEIINSLKIDREKLTATIITRESADDERQSAKSIGLTGVALFAVIFGTVLLMDIQALKRDALVLWANLCDGVGRVRDFVKKERTEIKTPGENRF